MYLQLLKELYFKERKKLEEMWIFKQEAKLKFISFRKEALEKLRENLSVSQILGRDDIIEEIKDNVIRVNEDKIAERIDTLINDEATDLGNEEKEELRNARYSAYEYAEYLLQLDKVYALEAELENNRLFREALESLYEDEQKKILEEKGKEKL